MVCIRVDPNIGHANGHTDPHAYATFRESAGAKVSTGTIPLTLGEAASTIGDEILAEAIGAYLGCLMLLALMTIAGGLKRMLVSFKKTDFVILGCYGIPRRGQSTKDI